jgi:hypothetical protein
MPFKTALMSSAIALITLPQLAQAVTVLRVRCEGVNVGAQVFVNEQRRGECTAEKPLDLLLEPGPIQIRAVKAVGAEQERVWERGLSVEEGSVNRLDIELSEPRLSKAALQARAVRAAQKALAGAERGDVAAMDELADRLQAGDGLPADAAQAQQWRAKAEAVRGQAALTAAQAGDVQAMRDVVARYTNGAGLPRSAEQAAAWQARIPEAENKERMRLAELARQQQAQAEAEERERQAVRRKAEIDARRAALVAQRSQVEYFPTTKKEMGGHYRQMQKDFLFGFASSLTASPFIVLSFLFEAATVAPSATLELKRIDEEIDALPTAWAKPDSMVARAFAMRAQTN